MIHFTIITCTYNAEKEIQRTLDSVKDQTWPAITHIIQDGKSQDKTVDLSNLYKATIECAGNPDRKVIVNSEHDRGLYDAMNKAMRQAVPDYVLFLNAGDTLHDKDTLMDIVAEIQKKNGDDDTIENLPGVIYGDTDVVDASNHYVGKRIHRPPEVLTWQSFSDGMSVCHQAFYARTDIAQKYDYNLKYRFSADVDWCIRVMKESERQHAILLNSHKVLCNFLAGGISVKNHKKSLDERFMIMVKHYGLIPTLKKHLGFLFRVMKKEGRI